MALIYNDKCDENDIEMTESKIETIDNTEQNEKLGEAEVQMEINNHTEMKSEFSFYNWNIAPKLLCTALEEYEPTKFSENFTKGCFWSPDGTCLLVPSEDFKIRIYELPRQLYDQKPNLTDCIPIKLTPTLTIKEGGIIYDTCWFPFMNSWSPETCCFLSTSKESPVHLWDAYTGELRATYRPYNQVDEIEAPISVQFVDYGKAVWCGFKNTLRIFDAQRPGRQTSTIDFKTDFPNVRGLVSCIRDNPVMPGLVAFGTYSKYIGLYKDGPICIFQVGSGVTQIEFSPCGTKMFTGVRRSNEFLCWDLRKPGTLLCSFHGRRSDQTNQRIHFSLSPAENQIISGGTDGCIAVWDLPPDCETFHDEEIHVKCKVKLSSDCINGISLHKSSPILAISTGQRLSEDEIKVRDNGIRLWWLHYA